MHELFSYRAFKKLVQEIRFPGIEQKMEAYSKEVNSLREELKIVREDNKIISDSQARLSNLVERLGQDMRNREMQSLAEIRRLSERLPEISNKLDTEEDDEVKSNGLLFINGQNFRIYPTDYEPQQ